MVKFLMALAFSLLCFSEAQAAKTLIIGLDLSNSSPLVINQDFAKKAAKRAFKLIKELKYRDNVVLRTFGEFKFRKNSLAKDYHLTRQFNPDVVAALVAKFISRFGPNGHKIEAEKETNILGFLDNMAAEHSCSDNEVVFILFSDGFEFSELADSYLISKIGKGSLPQLEFADFQNCSLQIWGIGYGYGPARVQKLKRAWYAWAKEAGFKKPKLVNDW